MANLKINLDLVVKIIEQGNELQDMIYIEADWFAASGQS
jgi:hypothetical protein